MAASVNGPVDIQGGRGAGEELDPVAILRSKRFLGLLVLAAAVGVLAALIAWSFLELVFHMQEWVFHDLPHALGFGSTPIWWSLPVLAVAGQSVG